MNFAIENDVISQLVFNGKNIINPWGIETSDTTSFFSLEKNIGYRYQELNNDKTIENDSYSYSKTVRMHDGKWEIFGNEKIKDNKVFRKVDVICLEDTLFLDFVMRFRFKKNFFDTAAIAGNTILHRNSNVYYQYQTEYCELNGYLNAKIKVAQADCPNGMVPFLYVRDHEDEWVIHARMLPIKDENIVIKLCNKWYKTKPLPNWMTSAICSNHKIYERIKYGNEVKPYRNWFMKKVCPNAFPMLLVSEGTKLSWEIEVEINEGT